MRLRVGSIWSRVAIAVLLAATPVLAWRPHAQPALTPVTIGGSTSLIGPDVAPADFTLVPPATTPARPINATLLGFTHQWVGYAPGTVGEWILYNKKPEPESLGAPDQPVLFGMNLDRNGKPVRDLGARIVQTPMFEPFNRDDPRWWDETLDEILYSRVPFAFWESRGCTHPDNPNDLTGPGNMCPYVLRDRLASAVRRAGAEGVVKFAPYILSPAVNAHRHILHKEAGKEAVLAQALSEGGKCPVPLDAKRQPLRAEPAFDLRPVADAAGHDPLWYFWNGMIKPFYDSVPRDLWYLYDDHGTMKPVIVIWEMQSATRACGIGVGPSYFNNTQDNIRLLLEGIAERFRATYGMTPFFDVAVPNLKSDPSLQNAAGLVGGVNQWFNVHQGLEKQADGKWPSVGKPEGIYTVANWNGGTWGLMTPSFFCGLTSCNNYPEIMPNGGKTLITAFDANRASVMNLIEGAGDPVEGNGAFRSDDKSYPYANRHLDIIREYSDPETVTTKFQAESADAYLDPSGSEVTGKSAPVPFRYGKAWGIVRLGAADGGAGWALGQTRKGESVVYRQVYLANGFYKFTARALAMSPGARLRLSVDGVDLPAQTVPVTGEPDAYVVISLGSGFVPAGHHDLKVTFESDAINLDWFFARKLWPGAGAQHGLPLPTDSIGNAPGVTLAQFDTLSGGPGARPLGVNVVTLTAADGELKDVGIVGGGTDGRLADHAKVAVLLANGRFVGAPAGRAERTVATAEDVFVIEKAAGSQGPAIADGDTVTLRGAGGGFLALGRGGPTLAPAKDAAARIVVHLHHQFAAN